MGPLGTSAELDSSHQSGRSTRKDYKHHLTGEENGDAPLKRSLIGPQGILPITKGKLDLGPWEQIFYLPAAP